MKKFVLLSLLALASCSTGGFYTNEGPHPHINVAGEARVGPVSILHTPVSNARPVTDLTVTTLNKGIQLGPLEPSIGLGWQIGRSWGACDATGHACEKTYTNGYVLSVGLTYHDSPLRIDLRVLSFDNSPVHGDFPLGIEALAFLIGFDL